MANITFNGLGSGLKVTDIVDAIVNSEKVPHITNLNKKEAKFTTDISAVGALKSALEAVQESISALADAGRYQLRDAKGNDDFITISSHKEAQVGHYSTKVDALAQAHKLTSAAFGAEESLGSGSITIEVGGKSFSTIISPTYNLEELRDQINDGPFTSPDGNNSVIATIITSNDGQHLVLSSKETGVENAIKITVSDDDGNDTDSVGFSRLAYDADPLSATFATNMSEVTKAQDAKITIDGTLVVTSATNQFKNVIDGVDITARKEHDVDDDLSSVTLTENNANIEVGIKKFIKDYNDLITLSKELGKGGEGGTGPLVGDSLLRGVMSSLRGLLSTPFESSTGETLSLTELGVISATAIDKDSTLTSGQLSFDEDILNEFVENDVAAVQNFFIGSDDAPGFAKSIDDMMEFYTKYDGLIDSRVKSKKEQISDIDDDRINFARKMDALEARLYKQYNAMDLLVANLNNTGDYLTQQLDNMPGVVRKK